MPGIYSTLSGNTADCRPWPFSENHMDIVGFRIVLSPTGQVYFCSPN